MTRPNIAKQGSKFDQMGRAYKQVSIQYNCKNFTHLSYSFRVTKPIIGAGRWHGPKTPVHDMPNIWYWDIVTAQQQPQPQQQNNHNSSWVETK